MKLTVLTEHSAPNLKQITLVTYLPESSWRIRDYFQDFHQRGLTDSGIRPFCKLRGSKTSTVTFHEPRAEWSGGLTEAVA